jgi:hypothetical protein
MGLALAIAAAVVAAACLARAAPEEAGPEAAGPGGLTALPAEERPGQSLVVNGGFEGSPGEPLRGWNLKPEGGTWTADGTARAGGHSLKLSGASGQPMVPAAEQEVTLEADAYTLEGWVKSSALGASRDRAGVRFCLDGRPGLNWWMCTGVARGTSDWTLLRQPSIPVRRAGRYRLTVDAYAKPDGVAWIDDVSLVKVPRPLLDAYLLYPNFRGLLFDDRPQTVRVALRATSPGDARAAGGAVRLQLIDEASGASVRQREYPVPPPGAARAGGGSPGPAEVPPPGTAPLAPGTVIGELDAAGAGGRRLLVRAELRDREGRLVYRTPDYRVVRMSPADRKRMNVWIDRDNVAHLDGKPAFVLGLYTTSGYSNSRDTYARGRDGWGVARMAEAPVNMLINYWLGATPVPALMTYMDELHGRGIHYLHTVNFYYRDHPRYATVPYPAARDGDDALNRWIAATLVRHPGLAGFYTADEQRADMVPRVFRQQQALARGAPGTVTYAVHGDGWEEQAPLWRDAADVMGLDPYPIKRRTGNHLAMVGEWTRLGQEAVMGSRPLWMVLQYFPLTTEGGWPSESDLRAMSWMAIVEGAKGLFYWSFGDKGLAWVKDPKEREQRWRELVKVTREIKALEPVLLAPDAAVVTRESSGGVVRALGKRGPDGARYLFAYNTRGEPTQVTWTLAEPAAATTDPATGAAGPRVEQTTLADRLGPYEVKRYKLR